MPERNLVEQKHLIDKRMRGEKNNQTPCLLWFTGLSGAGKSTVAGLLEAELFKLGYNTYLMDGDNVRRSGLNNDLGFSLVDRSENIRRVGEVSKLFVDAGLIVLSAFISPLAKDRDMVRELLEPGEFVEIFINCPLAECERRDPKGYYKKARKGLIADFTGIDSPYEAPLSPEIIVETSKLNQSRCVDRILDYLKSKEIIKTSKS
jgi:adenylylsulfate kinase